MSPRAPARRQMARSGSSAFRIVEALRSDSGGDRRGLGLGSPEFAQPDAAKVGVDVVTQGLLVAAEHRRLVGIPGAVADKAGLWRREPALADLAHGRRFGARSAPRRRSTSASWRHSCAALRVGNVFWILRLSRLLWTMARKAGAQVHSAPECARRIARAGSRCRSDARCAPRTVRGSHGAERTGWRSDRATFEVHRPG